MKFLISNSNTGILSIRVTLIVVCLVQLCACIHSVDQYARTDTGSEQQKLQYTTYDRLVQYGPAARRRWLPYFSVAGVAYPPQRLTLVVLKSERALEVYAGGQDLSYIATIPICGVSGSLGPKLYQGDLQVPEGVYSIPYLHPNSRYHLALRVDYPNALDQFFGFMDGRSKLGHDIMIHGSCSSQGCIAIGDEGIEDLFVLASDSGVENIKLIIAPFDFRKHTTQPEVLKSLPDWTPLLYSWLASRLHELPKPLNRTN